MTIPKILHQCWFRFGPDKPAVPPPEYDALRASWRDHHPDWEYRLWNYDDSLTLLQERFPEAVETFLSYPKEILRVDFIRYYILRAYGGVYTDCDSECKQPLTPLLDQKVVLVRDVNPFFLASNNFMMSEPNHPFMEQCCRNLSKTAWIPQPIMSSGPVFLGVNWLTSPYRSEIKMLSYHDLQVYQHHYCYSTWTDVAGWKQIFDKRRRAYMKLEEVPQVLRPFVKGWIGK